MPELRFDERAKPLILTLEDLHETFLEWRQEILPPHTSVRRQAVHERGEATETDLPGEDLMAEVELVDALEVGLDQTPASPAESDEADGSPTPSPYSPRISPTSL